MDGPVTDTASGARERDRFVLVGFVLPAALTVLAVLVQLSVVGQLPDPVAIHWGAGGLPDGFAPAWVPPTITAVFGVGIPALFVFTALPGRRRGGRGPVYVLLSAVALATTVLVCVLSTIATVQQVGLADAADARPIWLALGMGTGSALVAGVVGWLVQPRERRTPAAERGVAPVPLAAGDDAVWLRTVSIARSGAIVLGCAVAFLLAIGIVTTVIESDPAAAWIVFGTTALVAIVVLTCVSFRVRVDAAGLSVTSVVGWPRIRIPLAQIAHARSVDVNPMGEFGGWGMRWAPGGRFGVVLRTGPAIEVTRANGKTFTVTVDDADTGAGLLESLRGRSSRPA